MEPERMIVATIFILYGALGVLRPDWIAAFQKWSNKTILGAEFKASKRTLTFYRGMGLLFCGLAILLIFGVIE